MKRMIIGLCLMLIAAIGGGIGIYAYFLFPEPEEEKIQPIWLPPTAEIRAREVVYPGTFKINISLEELQATTGPNQPVLVIYAVDDRFTAKPKVEYWRSKGDGTFHYASVMPPVVKFESVTFFGQLIFTTRISFDKESAAFRYVLMKNPFSLAVVSIITILMMVMVWFLFLQSSKAHQRAHE